MKKRWYDYLWIVELTYMALGFFNILFAWLGMVFFCVPLIISLVWGTKGYCNSYCGRGQLFGLLGGRILGLITLVLFKPRSWCVYCPMGTMTQLICKAKSGGQ